jgi:hypothetical protein
MTKTAFEIAFVSRDAAMAFVFMADGLDGDRRFAPEDVAAGDALAELVDTGQQTEGPFTVTVPTALRKIAGAVRTPRGRHRHPLTLLHQPS